MAYGYVEATDQLYLEWYDYGPPHPDEERHLQLEAKLQRCIRAAHVAWEVAEEMKPLKAAHFVSDGQERSCVLPLLQGELVREVVSSVSSRRALSAFSSVCKDWHKVARPALERAREQYESEQYERAREQYERERDEDEHYDHWEDGDLWAL